MHTQDGRWGERERERRKESELVSACAEKPAPMSVLAAAWDQHGLGEYRAGLQFKAKCYRTVIIGPKVCEQIPNCQTCDSDPLGYQSVAPLGFSF